MPAPVRLLRARSMIRYAHSPGVAFKVEAIWGSILHVARQFPFLARLHPVAQRGPVSGTADAPCFQRVVSLFSLCYLLLEKLSKSLIPYGNCPVLAEIASLFLLENVPVLWRGRRRRAKSFAAGSPKIQDISAHPRIAAPAAAHDATCNCGLGGATVAKRGRVPGS